MATPSNGDAAFGGANAFNPYAFAAQYNMLQYAAMAAAASAGSSHQNNGHVAPAMSTTMSSEKASSENAGTSSQRAAASTSVITVGSEEDEELLVKHLQDKITRGRTYRQALDSLNEVNGFSSVAWKDYFLDHLPRLLSRVSPDADRHASSCSSLSQPTSTAELSLGERSVPGEGTSQHVARDRRPSVKAKGAGPTNQSSAATPMRHRQEEDAIIALKSSPSIHAGRRVQQPARVASSRDHSPPPPPKDSIDHYANGKVRYTDEDKIFLRAYLEHLKKTGLASTRAQVCSKLEKKAPHHPGESWRALWKRVDGIPRYLQYENFEKSVPTTEHGRSGRRLTIPLNIEASADEPSHANGVKQKITDQDLETMSLYIVSKGPEWNKLTDRERWEPFSLEHPKRTRSAWSQVYSKWKTTIHDMAELTTNDVEHEVDQQNSRPSGLKRAHVNESGVRRGPGRPRKRPRDEDESDY